MKEEEQCTDKAAVDAWWRMADIV